MPLASRRRSRVLGSESSPPRRRESEAEINVQQNHVGEEGFILKHNRRKERIVRSGNVCENGLQGAPPPPHYAIQEHWLFNFEFKMFKEVLADCSFHALSTMRDGDLVRGGPRGTCALWKQKVDASVIPIVSSSPRLCCELYQCCS